MSRDLRIDYFYQGYGFGNYVEMFSKEKVDISDLRLLRAPVERFTIYVNKRYTKCFGEQGIMIFDGIGGKESVSLLKDGIEKAGGDLTNKNKWVKGEIQSLRKLYMMFDIAKANPSGIWKIEE